MDCVHRGLGIQILNILGRLGGRRFSSRISSFEGRFVHDTEMKTHTAGLLQHTKSTQKRERQTSDCKVQDSREPQA